MNTIQKVILYGTATIAIALSAYTLSRDFGKKPIAYIDISKMLEGYKFKKEMADESTKNLYMIKGRIDSLKVAHKLDTSPMIDTQIAYAERAFEQYYTFSAQEMTKKVWDRLNPLLEDFGKEHGYQLIIGANGAGTVLYGAPGNDVTAEAIQYVNKKYEKGN